MEIAFQLEVDHGLPDRRPAHFEYFADLRIGDGFASLHFATDNSVSAMHVSLFGKWAVQGGPRRRTRPHLGLRLGGHSAHTPVSIVADRLPTRSCLTRSRCSLIASQLCSASPRLIAAVIAAWSLPKSAEPPPDAERTQVRLIWKIASSKVLMPQAL